MAIQGQGTPPEWKQEIATLESQLTPVKSCNPGSGWLSAAWIKLKNGFSQEAIINELGTRLKSGTIDGQTLRWFSTEQLRNLSSQTISTNQETVCTVYTQALHFAAKRHHSEEKQATLYSLYKTIPQNIQQIVINKLIAHTTPLTQTPAKTGGAKPSLTEQLQAKAAERALREQGTSTAALSSPPTAVLQQPLKPSDTPTLANIQDAKSRLIKPKQKPKGEAQIDAKSIKLNGADPKERYTSLTTTFRKQFDDAIASRNKEKCREFLGKVFDLKLNDVHFNKVNLKIWIRDVGAEKDQQKAEQFSSLYQIAK